MLRVSLLIMGLWPSLAASCALPRLGDYLDAAYIKTLQKSHSPLHAAAEDSVQHVPQLVSVQAQGAARRFAAMFDWHDGRLLFVLQRNGTIHRELAWGPDQAVALRVVAADQFCLATPSAGEHCYRYVRDAPAFIARATLVGHYVDRQGAPYWFGPDGTAHFPGYDFPYTIGLEQVAGRYDYFAAGTEGRLMAFRREGELLSLFAVRQGGIGTAAKPDFRAPVAVLRQAQAPRMIASN